MKADQILWLELEIKWTLYQQLQVALKEIETLKQVIGDSKKGGKDAKVGRPRPDTGKTERHSRESPAN